MDAQQSQAAGQVRPVRAHVFVSGRVQGVFFRQQAVRQATGSGLAGWVRNLYDGRVEAVFEGEPGAVERLVQWCHRGPSGAYVSDVEVAWEEPEGQPGFRVLP